MARQALMRLTNEALRAKLTEANLDTTGTKVALVERLLQHEASYVQGSSGLRTTRPRGHANRQLTSSESEGDEDAANPSDVPSETPDAGAEGAAASVPEVPSGTSASGSEETSETPSYDHPAPEIETDYRRRPSGRRATRSPQQADNSDQTQLPKGQEWLPQQKVLGQGSCQEEQDLGRRTRSCQEAEILPYLG